MLARATDRSKFVPMLGAPAQPTWRLFAIFGFPVFADRSALFLLVLILFFYGSSGGPAGIIAAVVVAAVVFVGVVGHEIGHAIAVRRFGYGNSRIVLGGLGGFCQWSGQPTRGHMIRIALAGPFASLLMGAVALALYIGFRPVIDGVFLLRVLVKATVILNFAWGIFNLLPIFPMDGGRALRTALGLRLPQREAVRRSLIVSGVVATGVAIAAGLIGEWFVALLLVWMLIQNWNEWHQNFS